MQENSQVYLMVCRILVLLYVPLSLLLTVSSLFTQHLTRSVFALLTIPLIFLPPFLEHFFHWKRSYRFNLLYFFTLLFCYTGGYVLQFNAQLPCYMLFSRSILSCFFVLLGISLFERAASIPVRTQRSRLLFAFGGTFAAALHTIIILAEAVLSLTVGSRVLSLPAVLFALFISIVSAALFSIVLHRFGKCKGFSFLLRAAQDLALRNRKPMSTVTITSIESIK
jgi:hypothetical protein